MLFRRKVNIFILSLFMSAVYQIQCKKSQHLPGSSKNETVQLEYKHPYILLQHQQSSISRNGHTWTAESGHQTQAKKEINNSHHTSRGRIRINQTAPAINISSRENVQPHFGPCSIQYCSKDTIVNCVGLSLIKVTSTWFPRNTTIILLDNNDLEVIDNVSFSHLNNLRELSLSNNNIQFIQQNAFRGLGDLETINLEYNRLTEASYPPGVFDPLVGLTDLRLRYNKENSSLPDNLFTHLKNLNSLTIDVNAHTLYLDNTFPNLTRLVLTGNVKNVDDKSFENLQDISQLLIVDLASVSEFTDTALQPLHFLDIFSLHNVFIGIAKSLQILKPLKEKNMTAIYFNRVKFSPNQHFTDLYNNEGILNLEKTKYLIEICVKHITLSFCGISVIEEKAFLSPMLNKCLRSLDLSYNNIAGTKFAITVLINFKHIEMINLENSMRSCKNTKTIRREERDSPDYKNNISPNWVDLQLSGHDSQVINKAGSSSRENTFVNRPRSLQTQQLNTVEENRFVAEVSDELSCFKFNNTKHFLSLKKFSSSNYDFPGYFRIYSSKSLKYLIMSSIISSSALNVNVLVVGPNNLLYLDLQDSGLRNFTGHIIGLDALQTLLLSVNDLSVLAEDFFDGFCHLEELVLFDCQLNIEFMSFKSDRIFYNLRHLKRLDLSSNMLYSLKPETFASNKMLEQVDLSKNRFKNIPFNLKDTPNLKILDLRENSLTSIAPIERNELDKLANQPEGFDLLLSGNVLSCGCDSLKFLYWLATTRVRLDISHNFTCINNHGQFSYLDINDNDLEGLWRTCSGETFLSTAVGLLFSIFMGFLSTFIIWKNKIFIKSILLRLITGYEMKNPEDYEVKVFVGYSDSDYNFPCFILRPFLEDVLHLTTYIPHRDMDPSWYVAKSIVQAINSSWRIILVISESFLFNDEWSMFTIFTAISSVSPANPARVVVLVHENLQHRLPNEVLSAVPEDNIIVVSSWTMNYHLREKLRTRLMLI